MSPSCCVCVDWVGVSVGVGIPRNNAWTPLQIVMNPGMPSEVIWTAYFIELYRQWYQHCSL
jgi:hypothetical protein